VSFLSDSTDSDTEYSESAVSDNTGGARSLPASGLRLVIAPLLRALVGYPRRQFDLPRWTRGSEFGGLHAAAVAWLDGHFEAIELRAPWLQRVGSDVWDFCKGGVSNPFLRIQPGSTATARCVREVSVVYGFDGPLIARLRSLDEAIPAAGWEMRGAVRPSWADLDGAHMDGTGIAAGRVSRQTRWMADRHVSLRWHPTGAVGYPPGGEGMPPWGESRLTPSMRVSWHSRGQERRDRRDPNRDREPTRNYLPLEVSQAEVPGLLADALARHEHALRVTIHLAYYSNPNALARPHRIPRYLLPTQPGH
jgi:hypothetical protein